MDSTAHISALIDQLDENLDNLQDALKGILNKSLTDVAAGYPMLDKAKFYILITYAIESAIFCTSAREHPVYRELERVKQYFQKAKLAEVTLQKPVMRLDQGAASRFIKAALAGNDATPTRQNGSRTEATKSVEDIGNSDLGSSRKRKAVAIEDESNLPLANGQGDEDNSIIVPKDDTIQDEKSVEVPKALSTIQTPVVPNAGITTTDTANTTETEAQKAERKKAAKARRKERKRAATEATQTTAAADESKEESHPKKKQKKHKNKEPKDNS